MRLPRLRRNLSHRDRDDIDWGTSSPAAIMDPPPPTPVPERSLAIAIARLKQQDLKAYTCTFSPRCIIPIYFTIAFVFLPIGAAIIVATSRLQELRIRYDDRECKNQDYCRVSFTFDQTVAPNSYLFYSLSNYHQNARAYVKSRSDTMNQGKVPNIQLDVDNCEQWLCRDDPENGKHCLYDDKGNLNVTGFIYPCGLTARSFFNDTFTICKDEIDASDECTNKVETKETGIAWWTDTEHKFKKGPDPFFTSKEFNEYLDSNANNLLEDEHFVVWMRLSAFPTFDKLFAIITEELKAGQPYYMLINNVYDVSSFNGGKYFSIAQTSWFGDGNAFLGTAYLLVGLISLIIAITLLLKHVISPSSPTQIDPAILLREHLAKFEIGNSSPIQLHQ